MNYLLVDKSGNAKTGGIPVTYNDMGSCPDCAMRDACYAKAGPTRLAWNRVGTHGKPFASLIAWVKRLPSGQLWRFGVAGDLPGKGNRIDGAQLMRLAYAARGTAPIVYTHKPLSVANAGAIAAANNAGLHVNLSADNLADADAKADLADQMTRTSVVTVLPAGSPEKMRTPMGRRVIVCPAQTRDNVTCESCRLCSKPHKAIIGFIAHGVQKRAASAIAMGVGQ